MHKTLYNISRGGKCPPLPCPCLRAPMLLLCQKCCPVY